MSISIDPVACIIGTIAIGLALYGLFRTYWIIVRVTETKTGHESNIYENNTALFCAFEMHIRNAGRPLHDVQVVLGFRGSNKRGWVTMPMPYYAPLDRQGNIVHKGEFAQGMAGRFGLKSYQQGPWMQALSDLKDPVKQLAIVTITSQGYASKKIKLGVGADLISKRWNEFASRINRAFGRKISLEGGRGYTEPAKLVPKVPCVSVALMEFITYSKSFPPPAQPIHHPLFKPQPPH